MTEFARKEITVIYKHDGVEQYRITKMRRVVIPDHRPANTIIGRMKYEVLSGDMVVIETFSLSGPNDVLLFREILVLQRNALDAAIKLIDSRVGGDASRSKIRR